METNENYYYETTFKTFCEKDKVLAHKAECLALELFKCIGKAGNCVVG